MFFFNNFHRCHILFLTQDSGLKTLSVFPVFSVEDVCQRYPNATEVIIHGTPVVHMLVMRAVSLLR